MRSDSAVSIVMALGSSLPSPIELDIVEIVLASSSSDLLQACAIASNQSPEVLEPSDDEVELVVSGAVAIIDSGLIVVVLMGCSLRWWLEEFGRRRARARGRRA